MSQTFFEVLRAHKTIELLALAGVAGVSRETVNSMLMDRAVSPESAAKVLSALSTMTGKAYSLENVVVEMEQSNT